VSASLVQDSLRGKRLSHKICTKREAEELFHSKTAPPQAPIERLQRVAGQDGQRER